MRNDDDLCQHVDYIHYNPVKHGHVRYVKEWPYSTFHRYVERGVSPDGWAGDGLNMAHDYGGGDDGLRCAPPILRAHINLMKHGLVIRVAD